MKQEIFKTGLYEYSHLTKPVQYTEDFMKQLVENQTGCRLVNEKHNSENIGYVSGLTYKENTLYGKINFKDEELMSETKSFSPYFEADYIENEDCLIAINPFLKDIAYTNNPRKPLKLENTGEDKMGDDINNVLQEQIEKKDNLISQKNEEILNLKNQIKELTKNNKNYEKEVNSLKENNEKLTDKVKENEPIIKKYEEEQENIKKDLLKKLSNGNQEISKKYEHFSNKDLQLILDRETNGEIIHDNPKKGVSAENAIGLNKPTNKKNTQPTYEQLQNYLKQEYKDYSIAGE